MAPSTRRQWLTPALFAALLLTLTPGLAQAQNPGPPSGDGIDPVYIAGNPDCATLNADDTNFPGVTRDFGFKINGSPNGTFPFDGTMGGSLTGGAPSDPGNSVTIAGSDGVFFDWTATLGIDAVIVKGGSNADAFVYDPEDLADTDLHAPVNPANGEFYGLSHIEFCYHYELTATKTANATLTRTYTWTIDKSVAPAAHSGFAGEEFSSDYDVVVDQTVVDSDWVVSGEITVKNPTPWATGITITDVVDTISVTPDCGERVDPESGEVPLAANDGVPGGPDEVTCTYTTGTLASAIEDGTNTATILVHSSTWVDGTTASAPYAFVATLVGPPEVSVTDSVQGDLGSASGDRTFEYSDDFACPTNASAYTNGVYTHSYPNTAEIVETEQTDSASVDVTCYAPVVTKDATASYVRTYTWWVEKSVDPDSQAGYPGDVLPWTWTVEVGATSADTERTVVGTIHVQNPAPVPMTVAVSDVLSDGTNAAVDCGAGATSLTIAAESTGSCTYTASPDGISATSNTATATLDGAPFTGTAALGWTGTIVGGTATVSDEQIGLDEELTASGSSYSWSATGTGSHTCSRLASAYDEEGWYSGEVSNLAILEQGGVAIDSDGALTSYECEAGFVDLLKLTNGVLDLLRTWRFDLYLGPDGFGTPKIGTSSTYNDEGRFDFGRPALNPEATYTVCEPTVPAGWGTYWQVDVDDDGDFDAGLTPYNPNQDDPVPNDVGNRCIDFGAGTTIPVAVGITIGFQVNNTEPGGSPRTPGYWKNWNSCTVGGQALNAERNGGWAEGFWLIEDVLNPTIGGGIVWDDIRSDDILVVIADCEQAVEILDQRVVNDNGVVGDGKKLASDAARTLAMHLLAAQLNFGAGACTTPDVLATALAAETLLDEINFDGTRSSAYLTAKSPQYGAALALARYLDQYNNGLYCGDTLH